MEFLDATMVKRSKYFHYNNTSITNLKKLEIQPRLLELAEQNLTPLPYPATQSLIPIPLKPQLKRDRYKSIHPQQD